MRDIFKDTKEALEEDKKFLADLDKNCELKKTEWAEYKNSKVLLGSPGNWSHHFRWTRWFVFRVHRAVFVVREGGSEMSEKNIEGLPEGALRKQRFPELESAG